MLHCWQLPQCSASTLLALPRDQLEIALQVHFYVSSFSAKTLSKEGHIKYDEPCRLRVHGCALKLHFIEVSLDESTRPSSVCRYQGDVKELNKCPFNIACSFAVSLSAILTWLHLLLVLLLNLGDLGG